MLASWCVALYYWSGNSVRVNLSNCFFDLFAIYNVGPPKLLRSLSCYWSSSSMCDLIMLVYKSLSRIICLMSGGAQFDNVGPVGVKFSYPC